MANSPVPHPYALLQQCTEIIFFSKYTRYKCQKAHLFSLNAHSLNLRWLAKTCLSERFYGRSKTNTNRACTIQTSLVKIQQHEYWIHTINENNFLSSLSPQLAHVQVYRVTMEELVQTLVMIHLNADVLQDLWEIDVKLRVKNLINIF